MEKELKSMNEWLAIFEKMAEEESERIKAIQEEEMRQRRLIGMEDFDINLKQINKEKVFDCMIQSVQLFSEGKMFLPTYRLIGVFPFHSNASDCLNDEQKKTLLTAIMDKLENAEINDENFYSFYTSDTGREINRVRYITKGISPTLIAKEEECELLHLYKLIFKNMLQHTFQLEPASNVLYIENLKYALSILSMQGTSLIDNKPITFVKRMVFHASDDIKLVVMETLKTWYQTGHHTFIHQPKQFDWQQLEPCFFMLNNEQIRSLLDVCSAKSLKAFRKLEIQLKRTKKYNADLHNNLEKIRDRFVKISEERKKWNS